ncbi:MAG: hypothetical protein L3J97_02545 [Thermoplasmata archaeon]|nr:hypothetical protein [Thermoplasmata archaeon]
MDFASWTNVAFAGVAVFGAVLLVLSLLAVRRAPSPRMALVTGGFLVITTQGIVIGALLFLGGASSESLLFLSALFEVVLLIVLFLATLVR